MASTSQYLGQKILNILNGTDITAPAAVYVGIFTTAPSRALPGTEPTDAAYARQVITFSAPSEVDNISTIENTNLIEFPVATENQGTIVAFGIFDAATEGNYLYGDTLNTPKTIETDDSVKFQIGTLLVRQE